MSDALDWPHERRRPRGCFSFTGLIAFSAVAGTLAGISVGLGAPLATVAAVMSAVVVAAALLWPRLGRG